MYLEDSNLGDTYPNSMPNYLLPGARSSLSRPNGYSGGDIWERSKMRKWDWWSPVGLCPWSGSRTSTISSSDQTITTIYKLYIYIGTIYIYRHNIYISAQYITAQYIYQHNIYRHNIVTIYIPAQCKSALLWTCWQTEARFTTNCYSSPLEPPWPWCQKLGTSRISISISIISISIRFSCIFSMSCKDSHHQLWQLSLKNCYITQDLWKGCHLEGMWICSDMKIVKLSK